MKRLRQPKLGPKILTCLIAICALCFACSILIYPDRVLDASVRGLKIWWEIVFPANLPFVICADILMGLGVVRFLGVFLEPLMRPLFKVPGTGGFVLAMGFASGYPVGAILATQLNKNNLCSKVEAERLVAFTATADPIFICGAVAVGMLHSPELGPPLAICYFGSALLIGVILRFYQHGEKTSPTLTTGVQARSNIIYRAFSVLYHTRAKDNRSFGKILGDAVWHGMTTLITIGGFIILFSVILEIFTLLHLDVVFTAFFNFILTPFNLNHSLTKGLVNGLFEVTNGTNTVSQSGDMMLPKLMAIGAILGWGGLSIHAQVASIIQDAGLSLKPYLISKVLHAVLCPLTIFIFLKPCQTVLTHFNFSVNLPVISWDSWQLINTQIWGKLLWVIVLLISVCFVLRFVKHLLFRHS